MPSPLGAGIVSGVLPACPQGSRLPPQRRRAGSVRLHTLSRCPAAGWVSVSVCPAPLHRISSTAGRSLGLCMPCPTRGGSDVGRGLSLPSAAAGWVGAPLRRPPPGGSAPVHICSHFVHICPRFKPLKNFFRIFLRPPFRRIFSEKIVAPRARM